jgi:uncharacterized membrane protein YfcA
MLIVAIALALLIGVALGLLGGGGSILTVPILRYVLGIDAHEAIALSLLVVGVTSALALVPHAHAGRVRWRTGVIFGLAGMAGAFAAGRIANLIPAAVLLTAFGLMMFATAVAMLRPRKSCAAPPQAHDLPVAKVLAEGFIVGAITGLVGAGGGFLVVPALVLLGGLPMDVAVGTSLVVIAMKSLAGFAGFLGHTVIDWALGAAISGAAIAGSIAGSLLGRRLAAARLRTAFGWFVIAMAFFILAQELPALLGERLPIGLSFGASIAGTVLIALGRSVAAALSARCGRDRDPPSPGAARPGLPPDFDSSPAGRQP